MRILLSNNNRFDTPDIQNQVICNYCTDRNIVSRPLRSNLQYQYDLRPVKRDATLKAIDDDFSPRCMQSTPFPPHRMIIAGEGRGGVICYGK